MVGSKTEGGDFLLHTDKYVTTNACLPSEPVRETLFSTLVDYTSYYDDDATAGPAAQQLQNEGRMTDAMASLAKMNIARLCDSFFE